MSREPSLDARAAPDEDQLRDLAPQVLGAVVRRYGHFDVAEDAVQEALLAAVVQWPGEGRPDDPKGWLVRVASRRMIDLLRADTARVRREDVVAVRDLSASTLAPPADVRPAGEVDDSLLLLFLCCHPALTPASQVALTLRAVGGLTTVEIARAFLVPEATMAQRISRAKRTVKEAGARFEPPPPDELGPRLAAVLQVLYLVFNEGYTATSGPDVVRHELAGEAVRLARLVHRLLPEDPEVTGLLALMLLTDARRDARTDAAGDLVPLAEQDRSRWNGQQIAEGTGLVSRALVSGRPGPYQLQAAIAAVHDEAPSWDATDWPQILGLYDVLQRVAGTPVVALNRAVAVAMVHGPHAGLAALAALQGEPVLAATHRLAAARAHLLELAGDGPAAAAQYRDAARRTTSAPERRYLEARAAAVDPRR